MASAKDVLEGLKTALKITKEAPVILEARSNNLFIGTHNTYHSVVVECPTEWEDFKVVLSFNTAKELPKSISGDKLSLEITEQRTLKLISKGVKLNLSLLDNSALSLNSLVTKYSKNHVWVVDGTEFNDALDRVRHAANDKSIGDVVLRGYHLTRKSSGLEFMASNGATMAVSSVPLKNPEATEEGVLLLNPEFNQVSQLLSGDTSMGFSEDAISLESHSGGTTLRVVSLLTKGKSFDYDSVIKKVEGNKLFASFDAKTLADAVKRTDFFTDEANKNKIIFNINANGTAAIHSSNYYGESSVHLQVVEHNLEDDIALEISGVYFLNYLSSLRSSTVTIYMTDEGMPIRLEDGLTTEVIVLLRK
jgi:DNA polymerase III sliding clamp (beta) subunit (PCNA family)